MTSPGRPRPRFYFRGSPPPRPLSSTQAAASLRVRDSTSPPSREVSAMDKLRDDDDASSDSRSSRPAAPAGSSTFATATDTPPAVGDVGDRFKSLRVLATVSAAFRADAQQPVPDLQRPVGDQAQELQRPLLQAQQVEQAPQNERAQQVQKAPPVQQAQETPQIQPALQVQQAHQVESAPPQVQQAPSQVQHAPEVQQAQQAPPVQHVQHAPQVQPAQNDQQASEVQHAQEPPQVQPVQQAQESPQVQHAPQAQQTHSHPYHDPSHNSATCGCCNLATDEPTYTSEERQMIAILTANWRARMVEEGRIGGDEGSAGTDGGASQEGGEVEESTGSATAGAAIGEGTTAGAERDDEGRQREEAGAEPDAMDWTPAAEGESVQRVQQRHEEKEVASEDQQQSETAATPAAIDPRHEELVSDEGSRASRATSEMTDAANRMKDAADNLRNIALLFGEAGGNAGIISAQPSRSGSAAASNNTSRTHSPISNKSKTPARHLGGGGGSSPRRSSAPPRRSAGASTRGSSTPAAIASSSGGNDGNANTTTTTLSYGETFRIAIDLAPFDTRIYTLLTPSAALLCERERYAEWWRRSFLIVQKEPPAGLPTPNDDPRARWRLDRQLTATWSEQECAPVDGPVGTAVAIVEPVLDRQGRLRGLLGGGAGGARGGRRAGSELPLQLQRTMATPTPTTTMTAGQKQEGNNQRRNGKDGVAG